MDLAIGLIILAIGILAFIARPRTGSHNTREYVAFHEAAHAVVAIFNGFRCQGVILNVTEKGDAVIHRNLDLYGAALLNLDGFRKEYEVIKNALLITLNIDQLPQEPKTIDRAKKYLQVLYAGDLVLEFLFDKKNALPPGAHRDATRIDDDNAIIDNLHSYLEKVKHPVSRQEARQQVRAIFEEYKEVRAAIHFLSDAMLKQPGVLIPEEQIIANLRDVKFFAAAARAGNKQDGFASGELVEMIQNAHETAVRMGYSYITTLHFFVADCESGRHNSILNFAFKDIGRFHTFKQGQSYPDVNPDLLTQELPLSDEAARVLEQAVNESRTFGQREFLPAHVFIAALKDKESFLYGFFKEPETALDKMIAYYTERGEFAKRKIA